jgi:hypothetical protein
VSNVEIKEPTAEEVKEIQLAEAELEGKSLEEMRILAQQVVKGETPKIEVKEEKPKDKPVKTVEEKQDEPVVDDDVEEEFEYRVDLGDGAGVQVFRGKTQQEVINKLLEAQKNATLKIREQAADIQARKEKEAKEAADQDYVLQKRLQERPKETIEKIVAERLAAERKAESDAKAAQAEVIRQQEAAASSFLTDHPEYIPNDKNGGRLNKALNLAIKEAKARGEEITDYRTLIEDTFKDLSESGLLELKSEDASQEVNDAKEPTGAEPSRIVKTEEVAPTQRIVRRSSGISQRSRTAAPTKATGPSEEELERMPREKLRELANKAMLGATD